MNARTAALAQSLVVTALFVGLSSADDQEALKKDLTAVIALHGLPCGQVVDVMERAENDYDASCKDGNEYRVYLNAEGRVMVEKRQ